MFARLTGTVDQINDQHVIIDVNGVGYLVACSSRTRARLAHGEMARLYIETQVREDAINLFGFVDAEEQSWFKLLTTVQGVGAKVGLSILSSCAPDDIARSIAIQDHAMLTRADGVGQKLATRIVTELKGKVPDYIMPGAMRATLAKKTLAQKDVVEIAEMRGDAGTDGDVISALVNLGYSRVEAFSAVMKVKSVQDNNLDVGHLIRLSLAELARNVA